MEPASGKAKPGRTRAACAACRANKQKCDGALRHPCKRCELYGIECEYPGGAPPSSARIASSSSAAGPYPPRASTFHPSPSTQADPGVAAALREIAERLRQIETGLEADRRRNDRPVPPLSDPLNPPPTSQIDATRTPVEMPADSNPLQILEQTIDKIEQMSIAQSPPDWAAEGSTSTDVGGTAPPDAIIRGLVSIADCEAAFAFFHERIQPWISIMGNPEDRVPLLVQSRSPFLFHAILLVTNYYNTSTSERAKEVYRGLADIVNTLLAYQILAPHPAQINSDLVRGLVLLLYYKPVQHAAYSSRGITDVGRIVHASKVNACSSMMIQGLIHRTAEFVGLPRAPLTFLSAVASTSTPVPVQVLSDLRVNYWLSVADIHGSLQSGRPAATDPTDALQTTRLFASLKAQPCDPRRAATLELYAVVRTPAGENPSKIRLLELARINDELDRWEVYWRPILTESQLTGDPLAYTVVQNLANFVTFSANSAVFTRWSIERQRSLKEGGDGRPALSSSDWANLQRASDAAQKAVFAVSVESTANGDALRSCRWPENGNGFRKRLVLDPRTVEDYRTALDTMTCISFVYSLILLVRMASAGLISCELECRRSDYEAGADIDVPQPLTTGRKLPRLLELGAAFLHAVAPNAHHPARKHSILLQMILKAGLGENTPHSNSSSSPVDLPLDAPLPVLPPPTAASRSDSQPSPQPQLQPQPQPHATARLQEQAAAPTLDTWLWDLTAPNLPVSSDGGSLLIPSAPGSTSQEPGEALRSILTGVNPFLGSFYSTQGLEGEAGMLDEFAAMDWGAPAMW